MLPGKYQGSCPWKLEFRSARQPLRRYALPPTLHFNLFPRGEGPSGLCGCNYGNQDSLIQHAAFEGDLGQKGLYERKSLQVLGGDGPQLRTLEMASLVSLLKFA